MSTLQELAAQEMSLSGTYLNHAASSPLPRRSAEALREYVTDRQQVVPLYQTGQQDYDCSALRAKAGALLGAPASAVAFVPTTTDGISGLLNGIAWRPGDNLVVPENEFPGVLYAALNLSRRGIEVRQVPVEGHLDLDRLTTVVDRRTRVVVASQIHWQTGHRLDLVELGRLCRDVGALSLVDAIQGLGQVPTDVTAVGIDLLVAGSYKWLMAIPGTALLCASDRALAEITPDRAGWAGMQASVYAAPRLEWLADAGRFHVGGPCNPALIALERSLDLLLELGVENIAEVLRTLLDRLIAGLPPELSVRSSLVPAERSGILSVTTGSPERDDALTRHLVAAGIIVARRGGGLRISPHWHNTPTDIDRFLDETRAALRTL